MTVTKPLSYFRNRLEVKQAAKPTAHEKLKRLPYVNPQQSSYFFRLPGELRQLVYEYALTGYPDPNRPYNPHSYYYRPGYTHARSINTNLLLSCRRIYLETGDLAVSQNEHVIYAPITRGPPGHNPYLLPGPKKTNIYGPKPRKGVLRISQRKAVEQVHMFIQQMWLEDWNMRWSSYCSFWSCRKPSKMRYPTAYKDEDVSSVELTHPPRLKLTIRHTDWWYFMLGAGSPLALDAKKAGRAVPDNSLPENAEFEPGSWGRRFEDLTGLKVLELELETVTEKEEELKRVVERAKKWRFPLPGSQVLIFDDDATREMHWTGSRQFRDLCTQIHEQKKESDVKRSSSISSQSRPRETSVVSQTSSFSQDLTPEECLSYYVVTLTYRAQPNSCLSNEDQANTGQEEVQEQQDDNAVAVAAPIGPNPATIAAAPGAIATNVARVPGRDAIPTFYG